MKKKAIVAVVALVLVLCCAMGGTLAWLVDSTTEVKNTFTYGDINISLWEHKLNDDGLTLSTEVFTGAEQTGFKMIPGTKIEKDPTVTVEADSEASWLFVEVKESENFDTFMTYAIAEGWTFFNTTATGDGIDTATNDEYVIYREVDAATAKAGTSYQVLAGKEEYQNGYVTVNDAVTKKMFAALTETTRPTLTFTAYAVQQDNLTLEEAYNQAFNAN